MSSTFLIVLLSLVGTSLAAGIPHIIDGDVVTQLGYWPWQGSLHERFGGGFVCGCSLISEEWAVTAASCVTSPPYDVKFGSLERDKGTSRPVIEIITHEDYTITGDYKYYDVAVLKFLHLDLTGSIKPITLGETEELGNDKCHITGWGVLSDSDPKYPDYLHHGMAKIASNTECFNDWPNIRSSNVCTRHSEDYGRPCRGDTGAPLVCYKGKDVELVGISSWQHSSCSVDYDSVYTRVSSVKTWILGKTGAGY